MASTFLTDLDFVPETFSAYVQGLILKKSDFLGSAAVSVDNDLTIPYGSTMTLPSWDSLAGDSQVKGSIAPTINAVTGSAEVFPILERVQKYGANDLVASFTNSDPFMNLGNRFADYWARELDKSLVSSVLGAAGGIGVTAVNNISGGAGAAAVISANAIIDTQAMGGEFFRDYGLLVVHSKTLAVLRKANLTQMIPDSTGTRVFEYYGDMRIVVSDTTGMDAGSGVYNTILIGAGAVQYVDGTNPAHVLEVDRVIGFEDQVASSRRVCLAPRGASLKSTATIAGATATNAELATAGNWQLGVPSVEGFRMRVLRHKIAP